MPFPRRAVSSVSTLGRRRRRHALSILRLAQFSLLLLLQLREPGSARGSGAEKRAGESRLRESRVCAMMSSSATRPARELSLSLAPSFSLGGLAAYGPRLSCYSGCAVQSSASSSRGPLSPRAGSALLRGRRYCRTRLSAPRLSILVVAVGGCGAPASAICRSLIEAPLRAKTRACISRGP